MNLNYARAWLIALSAVSIYADSSVRYFNSALNAVELEKATYQIGILKPSGASSDDSGDRAAGKLALRSSNGVLYQCSIPEFMDDEESDGDAPSPASSARHFNFTEIQSRVNKSMNFLKAEDTCIYKNLGWWTYEFCFGKSASQFHLLANGSILGERINLGSFQDEADWSSPAPSSDIFYHEQYFDKGSICELNQKPRRTVVKIYCGESVGNVIDEIAEVETCVYEMKVYSNLLCDINGFRKKPEKFDVSCNPVLNQRSYENYLKFEALENERIEQRRLALKAKNQKLFAKQSRVADGKEKAEYGQGSYDPQDFVREHEDSSMENILEKTRELFADQEKTHALEETDAAADEDNDMDVEADEADSKTRKAAQNEMFKSDLESEAVIEKLSETLTDLLEGLDEAGLDEAGVKSAGTDQSIPIKAKDEAGIVQEGGEKAVETGDEESSEFEEIERMIAEKLAKSNSILAEHFKENKIQVKVLTIGTNKDGSKELNEEDSNSLSSLISRLLESDLQAEKQRESQANYQLNYNRLDTHDFSSRGGHFDAHDSTNDEDDDLIVF